MRNQANYSNEGIDIGGCWDVIIRSCDDVLCFKAASERPTERGLVRSCQIDGVDEDAQGIKHPCSDSGVSLEMVGGGVLDDFLITGMDS